MNINTNVKKDDYKNLPNSPLDPKYKNSEDIESKLESKPVQSEINQFGKKENPNTLDSTKNGDNFDSLNPRMMISGMNPQFVHSHVAGDNSNFLRQSNTPSDDRNFRRQLNSSNINNSYLPQSSKTPYSQKVSQPDSNDLKKSYIQNDPGELHYYSLNKEMIPDYRGDMHKSTVLQSQVYNHLSIRTNQQDAELLGNTTKQSVKGLLEIFEKNSRFPSCMGKSSMILERESVLNRIAMGQPNPNVGQDIRQSMFGGYATRVHFDRKKLKRSDRTYASVVIAEDFKPGEGSKQGKQRAANIKNRLNDMTERLNRKLGIPT